MSFNRSVIPDNFSFSEELTSDLIGIGFLLTGTGNKDSNIENTLLSASIEGMAGDFRVLSLLVDWIDIHSGRINADRLIKIVDSIQTERVRCFWSAIADWKSKDHRLVRLKTFYEGAKIELLSSGTTFQIRRFGEDIRFAGTNLLIPNGTLRHRPEDILTPSELAKKHLPYYWRIIIGPAYRADMWAIQVKYPEIRVSDLAKAAYGSFATAWQVKRDWNLMKLSKNN